MQDPDPRYQEAGAIGKLTGNKTTLGRNGHQATNPTTIGMTHRIRIGGATTTTGQPAQNTRKDQSKISINTNQSSHSQPAGVQMKTSMIVRNCMDSL